MNGFPLNLLRRRPTLDIVFCSLIMLVFLFYLFIYISGADTESIDGQSIGAKENITIAEEENGNAITSFDEGADDSKVVFYSNILLIFICFSAFIFLKKWTGVYIYCFYSGQCLSSCLFIAHSV